MQILALLVILVFGNCITATPTLNISTTNTRIVGGTSANIRNHQHLVLLRYRGSWLCGGSLVSENHVVTAAHCVEDDPGSPGMFSIRAGSSNTNAGGQIIQVSKIWMHPRYRNLDYDIAVLKLVKPAKGKWIKPIALATKRPKPGQSLNVAGWGLTADEGGYYPTRLRAVFVPMVARRYCSRLYGGGITTRMLCAGKGGKDSCSGDSGGPLKYNGKLIGVVSWGYGCAQPGSPGVYADIITLKPFVKSKLKL